MILENELQALYTLSKRSTTELHSKPLLLVYEKFLSFFLCWEQIQAFTHATQVVCHGATLLVINNCCVSYSCLIIKLLVAKCNFTATRL